METINRQQSKDIRLIGTFVETYCAGKHGRIDRARFVMPDGLGYRLLCADCAGFMEYAITKRLNCPLEADKPSCKRCRIHCYSGPQRDKIRVVMAYAGRKLIVRGRIDYLWHYLF